MPGAGPAHCAAAGPARWLGLAATVSLALHVFALLLSSSVTVVEAEPEPASLETCTLVQNEEPKVSFYLVPETIQEELLRSIGYYKPTRTLVVRGGGGIHVHLGTAR